MRLLFLLAALLLAAPTAAQVDPMETQRCIWRCLAESKGADDPAYEQCVAEKCNDAPGQSSPAAIPDGTWRYGEHPVLGLSAHVVIERGAFGVACFPSTPGVGYSTVLLATDGLIPNITGVVGAAHVFDGPYSPGGDKGLRPTQKGFAELRTDACRADIDRLRSARELKFLDVDSLSLRSVGNEAVMTVTQNGRSYDLRTAGDVAALSGTVVVPLRGSSKALGQLIRNCPAIAAELADECGSGD